MLYEINQYLKTLPETATDLLIIAGLALPFVCMYFGITLCENIEEKKNKK